MQAHVDGHVGVDVGYTDFPVECMMEEMDDRPRRCPFCKTYIPEENINFYKREMKCTFCGDWIKPWCFLFFFG